jgi:putative peptidoglycan lipid II flippase
MNFIQSKESSKNPELQDRTETTSTKIEQSIENTTRHTFIVGAGILLSRIIGLLRQRIFAYYFGGLSPEGDAFAAAFRIPNFLQNVFGEGALSASLIPVYANLIAKGKEKEANRVANAILTILALITSGIVLVGILLTPYLIDFIAPGFKDEKRELTIHLVKILFPGAGLLVMSAWCLGILNSHRKFFLSYAAPVIWNCAIICALIFYGSKVELNKLAEITAWGSVIGSGLQFAIQLPTVLFLIRRIVPVFDFASESVFTVIKNFFPVFFSRGVVQISAYIDTLIATLLGDGPTNLLQFSQSLYTLPISLFGMSISVAELPAMASVIGNEAEISEQLRQRLEIGLKRIAVFIVPSSMAFFALGDVLIAAVYQTGKFGHNDVLYVWGALAGSSVGLLASTLGRLYSSTYFALKDTRTPLKFAVIRVILTTVLGYFSAIYVPSMLDFEIQWGVVGLTLSSGIAGWVEFILLRQALNLKIGKTSIPKTFIIKLWVSAAIAAIIGWVIKIIIGNVLHPSLIAILITIPYGVTYFLMANLFRIEEAQAIVGRFTHKISDWIYTLIKKS